MGDPFPDRWKERRGIARALRQIAALLTDNEVNRTSFSTKYLCLKQDVGFEIGEVIL